MKRPWRPPALSAPLGLLAFCWVGMRTDIVAGSESMHSYGFPLPWYAPDPASSQAYVMALGPLVLDLLAYLLLAAALVHLLARSSPRASAPRRIPAVLAWLAAAASLVFMLAVLGADVRFAPWSLDDYFAAGAQHHRAVQFGPGR